MRAVRIRDLIQQLFVMNKQLEQEVKLETGMKKEKCIEICDAA